MLQLVALKQENIYTYRYSNTCMLDAWGNCSSRKNAATIWQISWCVFTYVYSQRLAPYMLYLRLWHVWSGLPLLSTPMLMHCGFICIAFCLSVFVSMLLRTHFRVDLRGQGQGHKSRKSESLAISGTHYLIIVWKLELCSTTNKFVGHLLTNSLFGLLCSGKLCRYNVIILPI